MGTIRRQLHVADPARGRPWCAHVRSPHHKLGSRDVSDGLRVLSDDSERMHQVCYKYDYTADPVYGTDRQNELTFVWDAPVVVSAHAIRTAS